MIEFDSLQAEASAPISKTGKPFSKDRYSIFLCVDDIYTSIHTHTRTKAEARRASRILASNAGFYIEQAGMMPHLFQQLSAQREGRPLLPALGDTVWLTKDVAGRPAGSPMLVTESGWRAEDEGSLPENTFPIMGLPLTDDRPDPDYIPFPLALDEYTTAEPQAEPEVAE